MFSSLTKDLDPFARGLAKELSIRVPAALFEAQGNEKAVSAAMAKALGHVTLSAANFRRTRKVGLFQRLLLTRAFQRELGSHGFAHDFIRQATLVLVQALTPESR